MQAEKFTVEDLELFYKYASQELWEIEDIHIRALLQTHPNDFFIFYENKVLIGYCVALKENETFGFISSVLVLKKFRLLGYGKKIFTFALEHLKGCQIALDSVLGQESFYKKFGFSSYFDVNTYKYITGSIVQPSNMIPTTDFDEELSLQGVSTYLKEILTTESVSYRAIKEDNTIKSFAFSFAYKDGYKLTINSEDVNHLLALLFALADNYPARTSLYMQTTKLTPQHEALTEALKMQKVSTFTRMYNKIIA